MSEAKRGCGYRAIGGLYLVSDAGEQVSCDALPLQLLPCGCCGFEPFRNRGVQKLRAKYIDMISVEKHWLDTPEDRMEELKMWKDRKKLCSCGPDCPLCFPAEGQSYGLMFVGSTYYTPKSFVQEAREMGVSKRIADIPKGLELGKTWILLAHKKVPVLDGRGTYLERGEGILPKEPEYIKAVFYAFRPQRVEMPLWRGEYSDEELDLLRARGITPVLLDPTPQNKKRHKKANIDVKTLLAKWAAEKEEPEEE
jgi:hypothetical protein